MFTALKTAFDPASAVAPRRRIVGAWLVGVVGLVFVMIIIGGLTRLTDSGLSITEWKPVTGAIPPLSDAAWQEEFEKYRQIGEYALQNAGMSMAEFQFIYWWEWGHRQLGRFLGLAYALPLFVFWGLGWFPRGLAGRLVLILALGGMQGFIGWWMVHSGVIDPDRTDVSHYRLATHLGLAFVLFGAMVWTAADILMPARAKMPPDRNLVSPLWGVAAGVFAALVFVQIIWGALVAGLDAGRIYTDWPLMGGQFVPQSYGTTGPFWRDGLENPASVQFHHRILGYVLALAVGALGIAMVSFKPLAGPARGWAWAVVAVTAGQVALGIVTLVHAAPLVLSAAHQALAAILFATALLWLRTLMVHGGGRAVSFPVREPVAS